ncbi:SPOR domain-containing protein [Mangrovimonas aestuarii]|uniref:SPOR domain-containing protein n=1 Tax=Mangrovimonas aestuarii TaxID=3018443 RepID=UPI0023785805|nr:SPOR domain-containing protein [Mangrovimonas aestuarii]
MKILKTHIAILSFAALIFSTEITYAQEGTLTINKDERIDELLKLKKEINNSSSADRYRIQIFSGRRSGAEGAREDFLKAYNQWSTSLVYESPNYKLWVGSFTTRLEADRALKEIKKEFYNAFIFKPKSE